MRMHNPVHPGMVLREFMVGHSVTKIAKHLRVSRGTLTRLLKGKTRVKAEVALRLAEAFGLDAMIWLEMQLKRDLWVASRKRRKKIKSLVAVEQRKAA